jgi:hypothetical protein
MAPTDGRRSRGPVLPFWRQKRRHLGRCDLAADHFNDYYYYPCSVAVVVEATEPDAANGWDWDGWNPKPGLCRHKRAESGPLSLCRMTPAGRR